ncbi:AGE family epimerase/isomerase [Nitrospirillum pindoramense]|uniref:Mannose-6-phosphate isomerase type 3 n=1 Tax=Nitrospirillum amazonense TaxID=28077 RepID=A0A560GR58_9PROT|nr:AGE family epimerase/isomerase [Nitrospirillum amazonense]TWB36495.1 mannose-6-phosphate isomerase type 3 [Nitrospirillum amazonense]
MMQAAVPSSTTPNSTPTGAVADAAAVRGQLKAWLVEHAYPLWWEVGADRMHGGFHEKLGLDGKPTNDARRARVQARQVYSYSVAARSGWNGPVREAAEHGLTFFLNHYRRPDGLFRTKVAPDGTALDDTVVLYDQAFALFALAAAQSATPENRRAEEMAVALRQRLLDTLHHAQGGFEESHPRTLPLLSNPHMHMLEACLAWMEQGGDVGWRDLAEEIVGLALTRFIDDDMGGLKEFFDGDWRPQAGTPGRIVEPGHQFEWSWLMLRWSALSGSKAAADAAWRMIAIGEGPGVDPARGVAMNALLDDLTPHDPVARLWPQTERIKAAVLAALATRDDADRSDSYWTMAANGGRGLMKYFDTPVKGLWRDRLNPDGTFVEEAAPASSFYHIVCAIQELDRALATIGHPG